MSPLHRAIREFHDTGFSAGFAHARLAAALRAALRATRSGAAMCRLAARCHAAQRYSLQKSCFRTASLSSLLLQAISKQNSSCHAAPGERTPACRAPLPQPRRRHIRTPGAAMCRFAVPRRPRRTDARLPGARGPPPGPGGIRKDSEHGPRWPGPADPASSDGPRPRRNRSRRRGPRAGVGQRLADMEQQPPEGLPAHRPAGGAVRGHSLSALSPDAREREGDQLGDR